MTRAARFDLQVARGASFRKRIQVWLPGEDVAIETLAPGQRLYWERAPERVAAVRIETNRVLVKLRQGRPTDPWFEQRRNSSVQLAEQAALTTARAAYRRVQTEPATAYDPDMVHVSYVEIPSRIEADTIWLEMTTTETKDITRGPYSWDLIVEAGGHTLRLLEGTMVTVGSDAVDTQFTIPPAYPSPYPGDYSQADIEGAPAHG